MNRIGIQHPSNKEIIQAFSKWVECGYESEKHHFYYGLPWSLGRDQFDYLFKNGVLQSHRVLDVGCGSLRLGIHLIRYLETGNYFGIDCDQESIDIGLRYEIPLHGLTEKNPSVKVDDNFEFVGIDDNSIDIVVSYSVLSCLDDRSLLLATNNMSRIMKKKSLLFVGSCRNVDKYFLESGLSHIKKEEHIGYFVKEKILWNLYQKE